MVWSTCVPNFMLVDKSAQYHPKWSLSFSTKSSYQGNEEWKGSGVDGMSAEMLKSEKSETKRQSTEKFKSIFGSEETPATLRINIQTAQKGDLRCITLPSLTIKVFSKTYL